ncbi:MAG: bifunctional [glutamate--ammonia ligase]-adenylyl-L-tyrosine phosphorylase/[glutamate--ammonia-ligase] adenylyltransferase [Betaproteobacteria bacterium]|nr:bifunctional [glutamate--ammonia ligase]-adenylyl-L-tyrosine phosphorylase/[glutamate--ammonia-ligase] adenylyltransferase [Betaproteobacteria bacterium]
MPSTDAQETTPLIMTRQPWSEHSRFARRVRRRYATYLSYLPPGLPDRATFEILFKSLRAQNPLADALRITRQLVLERLLTLDCDAQAPLASVMSCMTTLAEFALQHALQASMEQLDAVHGIPLNRPLAQNLAGPAQRCAFWVVGMGKLGARELNVSSDIDLIYVYDQEGQTTGRPDGRGQISNQEYFAKVVRLVHQMVGEPTEHGLVFRMDLALRPNGNSGPPAVSLNALEAYFVSQGREWERFAWLKSRVVAGTVASAPALRSLVLPFVFRRYLDYSVFEALRVLHRQIREHTLSRSTGRPERQQDIKLGRGGIREIEFTVQLLQVVRGGQFPELRTRPTLDALRRLVNAHLMSASTSAALQAAYVFLRQVEHRIQYLDDQQTHVLPAQDEDLLWMALSLGFDDVPGFLETLNTHRDFVALEFDQLLGGDAPSRGNERNREPPTDLSPKASPNNHASPNNSPVLPGVPKAFVERLALWNELPRVQALREASKERLFKLGARTAQWLQEGRADLNAALKLVDWLETLLRRDSYLALLLERPAVHERLLKLLGAARWPARYLMLHPGVMDELAHPDLLRERLDTHALEDNLEARRKALQAAGDDDEESLLNLLRRAQHAEVFRTLTRDVEGVMSVEQVADELSALADCMLGITLRWCWSRLKTRHRPEPQLAILAYGKLGGKELGYGSDLDLVFVFDDEDERASEVYGQVVRKLINWLTVKTGEGDVYEIDTALRPNGNAGLLVTRFEAFAAYQSQRGSNTAWTWEHQAMTRARCVLGSTDLRMRFERVRHEVIATERPAPALRQEIMAMRERVRAAHPVKAGLFDVKHSPGGMVDVEFAVQFLVLSQSCRHPGLTANIGNIALLLLAQDLGLLPQGLGSAAADAYRELRRLQHHARLNEAPTQLIAPAAGPEQSVVKALWQAVFGPFRAVA